jgi:HemY protein
MKIILRSVLFFVTLAVLIGVVSWFADRPGEVNLTWLGYRIDTGFHVIVIGILVITLLLVVLYRLWWMLMRVAPGMGRIWRDSRQRKGYAALTDGLVAVAAGDRDEAAKLASKAEKLLENPPLTLLLSAQAAQLEGDMEKARGYFREMLDRPETAFLGLRGLITYALNDGDIDRARKLSRKAYAIRPGSDWLSATYYDLLVRNGNWQEAENVASDALKHKLIDAKQAARRQTMLLHSRALEARAAGNSDDALRFARKAAENDLDFSPAVVTAATLLTETGKQRRATGLIEKAWGKYPHPSLVAPYLEAAGAHDAMSRVRAMETLAATNRDHRESRIAAGEAALEAGLWGEARSKLQPVLDAGGDIRAYRMMARIEEAEHDDLAAAHDWLLKAAEAPAPESWVCSSCGASAPDWSHICGNCDAIETFRWMRPPRIDESAAALIGASQPEVMLPAIPADVAGATGTGRA